MRLFSIYILGVLTILIGACASTPRGVASNAVTVGPSDAGSLVRIEPGQQLVIQLNSNPSSGFKWEINKKLDQNVVLSDGTRFEMTSAQRQRQDQVGTQYLRFVGQQPGRTTIKLVYVQPRVGTRDDSPTYSVEVIVAPKPVSPR